MLSLPRRKALSWIAALWAYYSSMEELASNPLPVKLGTGARLVSEALIYKGSSQLEDLKQETPLTHFCKMQQ